jgi:hypothetical protein
MNELQAKPLVHFQPTSLYFRTGRLSELTLTLSLYMYDDIMYITLNCTVRKVYCTYIKSNLLQTCISRIYVVHVLVTHTVDINICWTYFL